MKLLHRPSSIPGVWAATKFGDWTVKKSPVTRNGLWLYCVRGERCMVIEAPDDKQFLCELATRLGLCKAALKKGGGTVWGYGKSKPIERLDELTERQKLERRKRIARIMQLYDAATGTKTDRCRHVARTLDYKQARTVQRYVNEELKRRGER